MNIYISHPIFLRQNTDVKKYIANPILTTIHTWVSLTHTDLVRFLKEA